MRAKPGEAKRLRAAVAATLTGELFCTVRSGLNFYRDRVRECLENSGKHDGQSALKEDARFWAYAQYWHQCLCDASDAYERLRALEREVQAA